MVDASFGQFLKRTQLLWFLAVASAVALAAITLLVGNRALFLWVNLLLTSRPWVCSLAVQWSRFGEWVPMLLVVLYAFFQSNKAGLIGLLIWLTGACFSWIFKQWLCAGKPRPYHVFNTEKTEIYLAQGIVPHNFNTFPSGHTITAFYAVLLLSFLIKNLRLWHQALLWLLAFGCGISRMVLVQHWPADVAAGIFFGTAAAFVVIRFSYSWPEHPALDRGLFHARKN